MTPQNVCEGPFYTLVPYLCTSDLPGGQQRSKGQSKQDLLQAELYQLHQAIYGLNWTDFDN